MEEKIELYIQRFKAGEKDAFSFILQRYKIPLIRFAYRSLGSQEEAEDAAQDILVKTYRSLTSYTTQGNFSTWLFAIASYHIRNIIRKKKVLSLVSFNELLFNKEEHKIISSHSHASNPENISSSHLLHKDIQKALKKLPNSQRTALLLSKYENMSLEEIAQILNTTPGAVKQLIFRAKMTLKQFLAKYI